MNNTIHAESLVKTGAQHRALKYLNQYILVMKLSAILIFLVCMTASAASHAQKVNLQARNESLINVLREITKQSGYNFVIKEEHLSKALPVTLSVHGQDATQVIAAVFAGQPFTYEIKGKVISIKPKPISKSVPPQQSTVRGRVTDSLGNGLEGVIVEIPETNIRTSTDKNGYYELSNVVPGIVLNFRLLGYSIETTVVNRPEINIILHQHISQLNEVLVERGYYQVSKELNTGSVSTVGAEILERQPVGDPLMALSGRIPGLYIQQTSGVPGASLNVTLRGRNSIANGNDPLYIIDGVPFNSESLTLISGAASGISPFSAIGMNNIERIDVLKDADATAIYGSRGANGVILITTKKGKAGKTQISASFDTGFGKTVNSYELMNTEEYLTMRREAFANDGVSPGPTHYDVNGTWDETRYTDWEKIMIGNTANLTNAQLSISGGSTGTQFLLSGQFRKETTVFPGDFNDSKASFHTNLNHTSANDRFRANFSAFYTNDDNRLPYLDLTGSIFLAPNAPALYDDNGMLNWENSTWVNPFAILQQSSTSISNNLNSNLSLSYVIFEGMTIGSRFGYNMMDLKTTNLTPATAFDPATSNLQQYRAREYGDNEIRSWIVEPTIAYSEKHGIHGLDVLLGMTFQETVNEGLGLYSYGFNADYLIENPRAATNTLVTNSVYSQYRYNALFGRFGYTYKDRYIVNLTGRRDGSSRFGPGRRFGNFGALGIAWIFSKEQIIEDSLPFLSFGKLRFSYGITGNDQMDDYRYLSTYSPNNLNYQGTIGLNPTQHTSPDFSWEAVKKLEGAVEIGLLQDRVFINLNWYRNRTDNQLVGYPLPAMTGFNSVQANMPAVVQNSGTEIDLIAGIFKHTPFIWEVAANLSVPKNKLVSFPNIEATSYNSQYVVGKPLNISMRYHYTGIDSETGIYTFQDVNNDGLHTTTEDRFPNFVGQRCFGGINNHLSFKGIELDLFFQFSKQIGYYTAFSSPGSFSSSHGNLPKSFIDRWSKTNNQAQYQIASQRNGPVSAAYSNLYLNSDAVLTDASFIRLKNVALSYSLPPQLVNKIHLSHLRIFAQAQNVFTITGYNGVDPEITRNGSFRVLPPLRMYTAGIQLTIGN